MTDTKPADPVADPVYYEVVLSTRKDLYGFTYKPAIPHVVDKATLDALGDAVAEKKLKE